MLARGASFSGRERNCCFLNLGDGRFANASAASGIDFPDDARCVATVDWDQDGNLDLWISNRNAPRLRLMRNLGASSGKFVAIRLVGRESNRNAIGARVELHAPGLQQPLIQTVRAGDGFLTQSSRLVHFGLGTDDRIDRLVIRWPSGRNEVIENVEANRRYRVVEGVGQAEELPRRAAISLTPSKQAVPPQGGKSRIRLTTLLPAPGLSYRTFSGVTQQIPKTRESRALLLNLWATWCPPCLKELTELKERKSEIEAAGIDVIALAVDGLGDDRSDPARAQRFLNSIDFPFPAGRATDEMVQLLQIVNNSLLVAQRPLPVPTSFLFDREGRVSVIYKGQLSVDDLIDDAAHAEGPRFERMRRAGLPGSILTHSLIRESLDRRATKTLFQYALALEQLRRFPDALAAYRSVVRIEPKHADAHNNIGKVLAAKGDLVLAHEHLEQAIANRADFPEALNNLANIYLIQGNLSDAQPLYEKALELNPDFPDAHHNIGLVFMRQGRAGLAESRFRESLRLRPNFIEAHESLGELLVDLGNLIEAKKHLDQALRMRPDSAKARKQMVRLIQMMEGRP